MRLTAPIGNALAVIELIGDEEVQKTAHAYVNALTVQIENIGAGVNGQQVVKARTAFVDDARKELKSPPLKRLRASD